jgi:hypothetical protein
MIAGGVVAADAMDGALVRYGMRGGDGFGLTPCSAEQAQRPMASIAMAVNFNRARALIMGEGSFPCARLLKSKI